MNENPYASPEEVAEDASLPTDMSVWAYGKELRLVARGLLWMQWELAAWMVFLPMIAACWWHGPSLGLGQLTVFVGMVTLGLGIVGTWYCAYCPKEIHQNARSQMLGGWCYFGIACFFAFMGPENMDAPGGIPYIRSLLWLGIGGLSMFYYLWIIARKVGNIRNMKLARLAVWMFWACALVILGPGLYRMAVKQEIRKNEEFYTWLTMPEVLAVIGVLIVGMMILYGLLLVGVRRRILTGLEENKERQWIE